MTRSLPDLAVARLRESITEPDLSGTRYRIVKEIGRGGMGVVYQVEDTLLHRNVALKVLSPELSGSDSVVRYEAQITARLEHPGIVPVHDAGILPDGRMFYTMKLIAGETLDAWARRQPRLRDVLMTFQRVCEPVAFAGAHGVFHRDVKPGNIMIGSFGEVLVLDWGVACDAQTSGAVAGTPGFMSPEQASGAAVDSRSDVYSLGRMLHTLLDGRNAPAPIRSICEKAAAEDARSRYPDALELSADIGRFLAGDPVLAHRETLLEAAARMARRHSTVLLLIAAYLVMRTILLFFSFRP